MLATAEHLTLMSAAPSTSTPAPALLPDRLAAIARFKDLTERALPALAREQHWPIRLDHCFKRICLDYAFEDIWYNHIPRPAERHLSAEPLSRAVRCAEDLLSFGLPLLRERNAASLRYRGKAGPHPRKTPA